ncbi:hypothetical protein Pmar_PMAR002365 [Perkinsus marinus ATCC 50983]|uniref:SET domain-containing protein n=1 Tax=Perkinsus marinus (strain ATCC 50983 / TXsc) TaxID=423536 RepID=C5LYQ9_PERM5|nr:hypothetical protein Pmar_PMAR002365 [Perkinsus marinus ATCC 50983]EEQ98083.1 hypothetical protein Pmar_PMAR002365 [Perkinsus marinus ATCC 50983]|eukprot:XP_002765366.1 hypothetical protein Pmar_PMAR002365 [Perkinsus marinus ATCC 50983]
MPVFPVDIAKQMSQVLDFLQGNEDGEMLKVSLELSSNADSRSMLARGRVSEGDLPGSYYINHCIALEDSEGEGTLLLSELPLAHLYDVDIESLREIEEEEGVGLGGGNESVCLMIDDLTESELLTRVIITDVLSRGNDYWKDHLKGLHPRWFVTCTFFSEESQENAMDPEVIHQKCRFNILGFETCPEMTIYQEVFAGLSGIGLYAKASGFNHSCSPNVNRFAVGTCQHFVTNRDINRGEQLTISYFEHEYCRKVPILKHCSA